MIRQRPLVRTNSTWVGGIEHNFMKAFRLATWETLSWTNFLKILGPVVHQIVLIAASNQLHVSIDGTDLVLQNKKVEKDCNLN